MKEMHAKVIALFEKARAAIKLDPRLNFQQTAQFAELYKLCSGQKKYEAMQGIMLYLRDKVSPLPEILIKEVAPFFSLELPTIPEMHEGRLSKTNEDYLVWGLANGLYPIEKEKVAFEREVEEFHLSFMADKHFYGTICTHFKKPVLTWLCLDSLDNESSIKHTILIILARCTNYHPYPEERVTTNYARDCWLRWGYEQGYLLHNSYPEEYQDPEEDKK